MAGTLTNSLGWVFMRQGRLDETRRIATEMADPVEPKLSRATSAEISTWGWLLLRASAAAVRDNRPEEADEALSLASAASRRAPAGTPDDARGWAFSPKLVGMKRVENAVVADHPDRALSLASRLPRGGQVPASDANRHRLDVASAHVSRRAYTEAFDILNQIRQDAPEWLAHQRYGRDVLSRALARRVRPVDSEVRELAKFMQVN